MSSEQFGDDAAALLNALEVERSDVMGYSQGGGVALQLALRHPQLMRKLVTLSATYRQDGWYPSVSLGLEHLSRPTSSRTRQSARHSAGTLAIPKRSKPPSTR
jgi:pimeloyl-ACP methyl ester carboxylesterase